MRGADEASGSPRETLLHKVPRDRPIQLASQPSPSCNGIFVVCSSYICRRSDSTIAQPNAVQVVQAIAAETNTPAETVSEMTPTRGLPDDAVHQLVIVAEHAERWAYFFRRRT